MSGTPKDPDVIVMFFSASTTVCSPLLVHSEIFWPLVPAMVPPLPIPSQATWTRPLLPTASCAPRIVPADIAFLGWLLTGIGFEKVSWPGPWRT